MSGITLLKGVLNDNTLRHMNHEYIGSDRYFVVTRESLENFILGLRSRTELLEETVLLDVLEEMVYRRYEDSK